VRVSGEGAGVSMSLSDHVYMDLDLARRAAFSPSSVLGGSLAACL